MTAIQKRRIQQMRQDGYSYSRIACELTMAENTVKSHCRRNHICLASKTNGQKDIEESRVCAFCGKPLVHNATGRPKRFCSEKCRRSWWKNNPSSSNRKAYYILVCQECGNTFESYGNKNRKYCCHACFIKNRFERMKISYDSRTV